MLSDERGDIAQSMAILEYLEELEPTPALLPSDPFLRAKTRQLAEVINGGVQPLQNLRVLKHLGKVNGLTQEETRAWAKHWIGEGLNAFQDLVKDTAGEFCVGDQVTFADLFLVPQLYNARRFGVSINHFPLLLDIEARLSTLEALPKRTQSGNPTRQVTLGFGDKVRRRSYFFSFWLASQGRPLFFNVFREKATPAPERFVTTGHQLRREDEGVPLFKRQRF